MKLTKETVNHLAHLARLEFSEEEQDRMLKDMDKILGFVAKIEELDLEGIEPLKYMSEEVNVLRADEVKQEITKDQALKNAPDRDSDYIRVPKVLNKK